MEKQKSRFGIDSQESMAEAIMILCDTNILIEFFKDNTQIVLELRQIGQNRIGIRQKAKSSTITYNLAPLTGD